MMLDFRTPRKNRVVVNLRGEGGGWILGQTEKLFATSSPAKNKTPDRSEELT